MQSLTMIRVCISAINSGCMELAHVPIHQHMSRRVLVTIVQPSMWGHAEVTPRCTRNLHTSAALKEKKSRHETASQAKSVVLRQKLFDEFAESKRNKETFLGALTTFEKRDKYRRGSVEFVYAAIRRMEEFGVEKDLQSYKAILCLFPEGKMVPQNMFQAGFIHYPKQQECAVDILQHMEDNGVCPDDEMGRMLHARFGGDGHPVRKFQRMLYWMPKFKHISPFPLPRALPDDPADLAVLALRRIAVDAENKIDVYREDDLPDSAVDRTFVVTAQAPEQMRLIARHPTDVPVFVEGAFKLWLRNKWVHYFVLKADPKEEDATRRKRTQEEEDAEDPCDWQLFFEETTRRQDAAAALVAAATVHEQEDGCVLALCVTGTNSRDSLASWLKLLQRDNPALAAIPVVFRLRSAAAELQTVDDASSQHPASVVETTT